jgi:hypothetical protein
MVHFIPIEYEEMDIGIISPNDGRWVLSRGRHTTCEPLVGPAGGWSNRLP